MPRVRFVLPVCFSLAVSFNCLCYAQTPLGDHTLPPALQKREVTLRAKSVSLDEIVEEIAKLTGCNIIVNDHPIRGNIDVDLSGPLPRVLASIADQFDYEIGVTKGGVVLFTKRFTDPKEFPNVTWQEARHMALDMLHATSAIYINPEPDRIGEISGEFNASITPAQMTLLKSHTSLKVSELSPIQQALIRERINQTLLSPWTDWREMMKAFEGLPNASLHFGESHLLKIPKAIDLLREHQVDTTKYPLLYDLFLDLPNGIADHYSLPITMPASLETNNLTGESTILNANGGDRK